MNGTRKPYSRLKSDPAERFDKYADRNGPIPEGRPGLGKCWEWTAARSRSGYGVFHPSNGTTTYAHRYAYESLIGAIPSGLVIDHLCRNRACVNPDHLEPIADEENQRRGKGYRLRNGMDSNCIHGHAYTPENTYINPNDSSDIRCRECSRIRDRKRAA